MAEESVDIPVTPEETESYGVDLRRHSTGKPSTGNMKEKVHPHYLRASTGSCHDFCKFGRKHEFEVKERRSIPKRVTRKPLGQSSEESVCRTNMMRASVDSKPQNSGPGRSSEESVGRTKKTSVGKQRAAVDSMPLIPALGQISEESVGRTKKTSLGKQRASLDSKSLISSPGWSSEESVGRTRKMSMGKQRASVDSKALNSAPDHSSEESNGGTRKTTLDKLRASAHSKLQTSDTNKKEKPTKSTDSQKQVKNEVPVVRKTSLVKVQTTSNLPKTMRMGREISSTFKVIPSPKWSSLKAKQIRSSEKHMTSSKPNSVTVKTTSSIKPSKGSGGQRNSELKMVKRAGSFKVAAKDLFTPSRTSFSPRPSLKRVASINSEKLKSLKTVSYLKNQPKIRKDEPNHNRYNEVEEKTLYVIKMESEKKTTQCDQNASDDIKSLHPQTVSSPKFLSSSISQSSFQEDPEESQYTTSDIEEDSFSDDHEFEHTENGETLPVEEKDKPGKDGIVSSEDMDSQISKLKFRRGKVVEIQSEKKSPRKLKFRRSKVLGGNENVKDEARRKSFKKIDGAGSVSIGATNGPEKVVLRHQDVQDKKDAQGLFNNVIEETASKLAETRKSKVKALVGAFETVISLQERKPSADIVS